jgi:RNA polymerase sigma factor (sigma-70 family)
MMATDSDLLRQFILGPTTREGQDAFTGLVNRHLNLVYSAAMRQVRSPHLAEEVSQAVFTRLARYAGQLNPGTLLSAWLHQVTHHAAIDVVRREGRRQNREQIAYEMSLLMSDNAADWALIEPHLDQAVQSLEEADRAAILLRYFENKSLREVGEALGASEDAAQKRVGRALDRLRDYFTKHKIAVASGALATVLSAHVVQAAPAGLSTTISAGSLTAASFSTASLTTAKIIAMTTLQKIAVGVVLMGAAATIAYQRREISQLHEQTARVAEAQAHESALTQQIK